MSWICKNCETENPDILDVCEVCETHAPKIIDFSYDRVLCGKPIVLRWKTEFCDKVSFCYKGETSDVTGKESYSLENPDEQDVIFFLSNSDTTTRTVSFELDFIERPTIEFSSSKSKLKRGKKENSLLTWKTEKTSKVYLIVGDNREEIPSSGKLEVCPNETTSYIIEYIALDDVTTFTEELQIGVFDECEIEFNADKNYIFPTVPVLLSWNVKNAKKVWLDQEEEPSSGKKVVEPEKNMTYVLSAEDEFGTKEKRVEIQMLPIPLVKSLFVPAPNIANKLSITIKQPQYNVSLFFPNISIEFVKTEVPKVPSFKDLGLNVELSPPLRRFSLKSSIKKLFSHLKGNSNGRKRFKNTGSSRK
ncbi:MAG: hypothetical protein IJP70_01365 [Bacteroidales bacterium]|nr:hypothetical protein [Bacteroidales bacterium]